MMEFIDKQKEKIGYQSLLLATFCGIASLLLVSVQTVTRPVIELRVAEDQNALLDEVLNGVPYANKVFENGREYEFDGKLYVIYQVKDDTDKLTAYVISGSEEGYSGKISYLMGTDPAGRIKGVRVLSHTETPGLGDKIEIDKSDWVLSFNGRSLSNTPLWAVKKDGGDFDQFTGATITPRSVVKGVHNALRTLEQAKEKRDE